MADDFNDSDALLFLTDAQLRRAILRHGLPERPSVDDGSAFRARQPAVATKRAMSAGTQPSGACMCPRPALTRWRARGSASATRSP